MAQEAQVIRQVDEVRQEMRQYLNQREDRLRAQYEAGEIDAGTFNQQLRSLTTRKTALDSVAGALTTPGGFAGAMVGASSPMVDQAIKAHSEPGSAGNILAHGAWGAVQTLAGGGNGSDALRTAVATGAAEYTAPLIAQAVYGTSDPRKLNAIQKNNLNVLLGTAATGIGASGGNGLTGAMAGRAVDSALNHNYYFSIGEFQRARPEFTFNDYGYYHEDEIAQEQADKDNLFNYHENKKIVITACEDEDSTLSACGRELSKVIEFTSNGDNSKEIIGYKKQSLIYLDHYLGKDFVKRALEAYEIAEDHSIGNKYISPLLDIGTGFAQINIGSKLKLLGIGGPITLLGMDNLKTGLRNFGKPRSEQEDYLVVKGAKNIGMSDGMANITKLGLDIASPKSSKSVSMSVNQGFSTEKALTNLERAKNSIKWNYGNITLNPGGFTQKKRNNRRS